jgi:hypothetical protein
MTLLMMVALVD